MPRGAKGPMRSLLLFVAAALAASAWAASPWLPDAAAGPVLASAYSEEFKEYWVGAFRKQNGIVLFVLGLGALSVFIITRSKAKK